MTKIYFIEGMSCGSCVAKVKTALQKVEGINSVEVQLQIPQAIIKADAERPEAHRLHKSHHHPFRLWLRIYE